MDITQLLLPFIIIVSTIVFVVIGIQLFFVLRQMSKTLGKIDTIISNAESTTTQIQSSVDGMVNIFEGFTSLLKTIELMNLIAPIHDYFKRKHAGVTVEPTPTSPTQTHGFHALMDKMKRATNMSKTDKKFYVKH